MKLLQFIVVDGNTSVRRGENSYTVTGECYLPLESSIPVIQKGRGCIGLGIVKELNITVSSTRIKFEMYKDIAKDKRDAYYELYQSSASVTENADDPYENTDTFIPGAMVGKKSQKSRDRSRGTSLSDYVKGYQDYDDFR